MRFFADLHIHSKYSRATSRDCNLENLAYWGRKKGITVIGTGDFTHPAWITEIKEKLCPAEPGFFKLRDDLEKAISQKLPPACQGRTRFMLSVEISTIYKKGEKTRKVHHLVYAPSVETAEKINRSLSKIGNIQSDGRPILGLDSRHLLEIVLEASHDCYIVPAHIWTPWFSVLGSKSGFDAVSECYGDLADHIFAVETGLSSDPEMNWRVSGLDRYRLVSNSDAHSPQKLGREACLFDTELDYFAIRSALQTGKGYSGTVEFFPEEGKYHLDGHRNCGVRLRPEESRARQGLCPICEKPLTLGVMYRVEELADRPQGQKPAETNDFKNLIPLPEIISETLGSGLTSQAVVQNHEGLLAKLGPELEILGDLPLEEIRKSASPLITEAISRMRQGNVIRDAGFDGEYGKIKLFTEKELKEKTASAVLFDWEEKTDAEKDLAPSPFRHTEGGSVLWRISSPPLRGRGQGEGVSSPKFEKQHTKEACAKNFFPPLDPAQQKAADTLNGPVLIIAGPGSGKTRVLTHRVANLILNHNVPAEQCLTITFTRRAAREMQERLKILVPENWNKIPVTTFHAFGFQFLQENRVPAGLPRGFRIAGTRERKSLLMSSLKLSDRKASKVLQEVSRLKRTSSPSPLPLRGGEDKGEGDIKNAFAILEKEKETTGILDYDDLLASTVKLLEENSELTTSYRKRYPWISIDEYQDINELQYRLIKLLAPADGNICAIGDPDQAIYSFRGANVEFFLRFEKDFPNTQVIRLTKNYRSGQSILSASNQVIAPSTLVEDRTLEALLEDTGKVVIHQASSDKAEAEFIIERIEKMIGGISFFSVDTGRSEGEKETNYSFSDFAILYRTDAQAGVLEEALRRSGIPFQRSNHNPLIDNEWVQAALSRLHELEKLFDLSEALKLVQTEGVKEESASEDRQLIFEKLKGIAERSQDSWNLFWPAVSLEQDMDTWDARADRVSLMTLHAAKGLEFPVVFITGCEEGLIPLTWGNPCEEVLAEERRLFYVGMTRAKDRLFLTHTRKRLWRGTVREQKPSPFLTDIEEKLLERHKSSFKPKPAATKNLQWDLL